MKKQISAVLAAAVLVVLAACGSTPTASEAPVPSGWHANEAPVPGVPQSSEAPQDSTTGRVPNMMGSGN